MIDKVVDADVVREHIAFLRSNGMTFRSISMASGVPIRTVEVLCQGYRQKGTNKRMLQKTIRAWNGNAILHTQPEVNPDAVGFLPAQGTRRRIQALMTLGWSASRQARMLGMRETEYRDMLYQEKVTSYKHVQVKKLYDTLWKTEAPEGRRGSVNKTKGHAKKNGYFPPLAWDNIDTDPTPARSLEDEVDDMMNSVGFRETVRYLIHKGKGPSEISRLTGKSQTAVARNRDTMDYFDSKHTTAA